MYHFNFVNDLSERKFVLFSNEKHSDPILLTIIIDRWKDFSLKKCTIFEHLTHTKCTFKKMNGMKIVKYKMSRFQQRFHIIVQFFCENMLVYL